MEKLQTQLTQQLFNRRDKIPPRPDVLWLIQRGVVRTLTLAEEGTVIALGYWGPGDIVGAIRLVEISRNA